LAHTQIEECWTEKSESLSGHIYQRVAEEEWRTKTDGEAAGTRQWKKRVMVEMDSKTRRIKSEESTEEFKRISAFPFLWTGGEWSESDSNVTALQ